MCARGGRRRHADGRAAALVARAPRAGRRGAGAPSRSRPPGPGELATGRAARVRLRGGDAVCLAAPGRAGRLLRQRRAAGPGGGSAGGARPGEAA